MIRIVLATLILSGTLSYTDPGQAPIHNAMSGERSMESVRESTLRLAALPDTGPNSNRVATPESNLPEFLDTTEWTARRTTIELCLARYFTKHVNADKLRPWSIMHGIIAYGQDALIVSQDHTVNAIDYLCANGLGSDRRLLFIQDGRLQSKRGQGYQGHAGQLLAILAQSDVPADYAFEIDGQSFSILDLIEDVKRNCRAGTELTFQLIALSHYLKSDYMWKNDRGQTWSIPRLIREELAQPINGAACGGTHRLMALSYAVKTRRDRGESISGPWERAQSVVEKYQAHAIKLQNDDGSFSTEFFERGGNQQDDLRKLYTTGHILEWLAFSLSDEQLYDPAVVRSVDYLTAMLMDDADPARALGPLDVGPTGHAVRALRLYEQRAFGTPSDHQQLAERETFETTSPEEVRELQEQAGMVEKDTGYTHPPDTSPNRRRGIFRRR